MIFFSGIIVCRRNTALLFSFRYFSPPPIHITHTSSISEQMGRILQRTSISTNIKERLDFSCALFGPDGGLVSNAPHIPVHLGAMQSTVRYQMTTLGDDLHPGDVILANHPQAGQSFERILYTFGVSLLLSLFQRWISFARLDSHHARLLRQH